MTKDQLNETISDLRKFISRACQNGARPEEIAVLPDAVNALVNLENINFLD